MGVRKTKANAVRFRFSKLLAGQRQQPSRVKVRSTNLLLGGTSKPLAWSDRVTIAVETRGKVFPAAERICGPWSSPSGYRVRRNRNNPNRGLGTSGPPSRSWRFAGRTTACSRKPTVSTRVCHFLPLVFLPAS